MLLKLVLYVSSLASVAGFISCESEEKQMLMESDTNDVYPPADLVIKYHTEWTKGHYHTRINEFKKKPLNFGDIVFIGNSITEGGNDWAAKFGVPSIKNRGIAGDVTDGVLQRLNEITYFKPKKVFLLIGINDLFNLRDRMEIPSTDYIGNNIMMIAKKISEKSPDTKIFIQTILPTDKEGMKENISKVNDIIRSNEKDSIYKVIDLNILFADSQGLLKKDLTYDGIHLNDSGYKEWVNYISNIVKQ
jgi:lysophospholipase L1-like esterase